MRGEWAIQQVADEALGLPDILMIPDSHAYQDEFFTEKVLVLLGMTEQEASKLARLFSGEPRARMETLIKRDLVAL